MQAKKCTGCGFKKPVNEFHAHPMGKYGVSSRCKGCTSAAAALRNKKKVQAKKHKCFTCKRELLVADFPHFVREGENAPRRHGVHCLRCIRDSHKRCKGCQEIKPFSDFYPSRTHPEAREQKCRQCRSTARTQRRVELCALCPTCEKEKPKKNFVHPKRQNRKGRFVAERHCIKCTWEDEARRCKDCGLVKPLSKFGKRTPNRVPYHRQLCNSCLYQKRMASIKNNPNRYKAFLKRRDRQRTRKAEYCRRWRKENPIKARIIGHHNRLRRNTAGGSFKERHIQAIYNQQKGQCFYCARMFNGELQDARFHIEHVVPIAKGGTNDPANLVLACPSCNSKKKDRPVHDLVAQLVAEGVISESRASFVKKAAYQPSLFTTMI